MLLVSIIGCTSTLILSQYTSAVIASAIIGLIGGLILKEYQGINYAASFAGMSSLSAWTGPILGALVFIVWLLLEDHFKGVGGKLGTIALISGIIYCLFTGNTNLVSNWDNINILTWMIIGAIGTTFTLGVRKEIINNSDKFTRE